MMTPTSSKRLAVVHLTICVYRSVFESVSDPSAYPSGQDFSYLYWKFVDGLINSINSPC
jgi:hypothetical protein